MPKIVGSLTVALGICGMTAVLWVSASGSQPTVHPRTIAAVDPAEAQAREAMAQSDLARVKSAVPFRSRLPLNPPAGYRFVQVNWDPGRPDQGFGIWMSSTDGRNYSLHLIEAPDMPNAPKNFFHQSGLHDVTLSNGGWKVTQKTTDPWKGLWIYGTVFAGVHIEIDGTDQVAVKGLAESI